MKHFTFKQVGTCMFTSASAKYWPVIKPDTCGKYEFVTIGNRNTLTAIFISSPKLPENICALDFFELPYDGNERFIQYIPSIGGYLYAWTNS